LAARCPVSRCWLSCSRWWPPPSRIFQIFNGRTARGPNCVAVPNLVEMGQTAAVIWRFFDFSKMAAVRHLGFVVCVRTTHEGHLVVFSAVQNLVGIDAVVLIICMFLDFATGWKTPIHAPKIGVWVDLPRKWGAISTKPKRGTSLHESASFEPSCAKIRRRV